MVRRRQRDILSVFVRPEILHPARTGDAFGKIQENIGAGEFAENRAERVEIPVVVAPGRARPRRAACGLDRHHLRRFVAARVIDAGSRGQQAQQARHFFPLRQPLPVVDAELVQRRLEVDPSFRLMNTEQRGEQALADGVHVVVSGDRSPRGHHAPVRNDHDGGAVDRFRIRLSAMASCRPTNRRSPDWESGARRRCRPLRRAWVTLPQSAMVRPARAARQGQAMLRMALHLPDHSPGFGRMGRVKLREADRPQAA